MSTNNPLASIVIPSFNRADLLPRAIESALNQSYDNVEIIVVDDGSTDETARVLQEYEDKIRAIRFNENQGANAARNAGIKHSTGNFISFLDSDDAYPPDNIAIKVEVLKTLPESFAGVFTPHKTYKDGRLWRTDNYAGAVVDFETLRKSNVIGGFSCVTVRKSLFDDIGYLDESLPSSQDYDFYLRLTKQYHLKKIEGTYVMRYANKDNIGFDIERKLEGHKRLLEKHGDILTSKRKARQFSSLGVLYARKGSSREARRYFKKAVQENPYELRSYPLYVVGLNGDKSLYFVVKILDSAIGIISEIKYIFKSRFSYS